MNINFEIKENSVEVLNTPIFKVTETKKVAPNGKEGKYVSLDAPNWVSAIVKNVATNEFIMTKQWRHGVNKPMIEFPCGMVEFGESSFDAVIRECAEEIGLNKDKILSMHVLYKANPNPAFMNNYMTCYYIEVAGLDEKQHLDDNEFIEIVKVDGDEMQEIVINEDDSSVMTKYAISRLGEYLTGLKKMVKQIED